MTFLPQVVSAFDRLPDLTATVHAIRVAVALATFVACTHSTDPGDDSTEIAYWGSEPDGPGIYLASEGGRKAELIASTADGYVHCLSWSPDGRQIAYAKSAGQQLVYQTWIVDVQTLANVPITTGPDEHTCPSWDPSGTRLAYFFRLADSGAYHLRSLRPDGSDDRPISQVRVLPNRAAWSPDGNKLAVPTYEPSGQIGLIDLVTGTLIDTLTVPGVAGNWAPDWSFVLIRRARHPAWRPTPRP